MKKVTITPLALGISIAMMTSASAALSYTTGLDVWLDASDIDGSNNSTLTDGDAVTTWKNKGTTGVNDAAVITSGGDGGTNGTYAAGGGNGGQDAIGLANTRYQFGQEFMDSPNVTMYFVVNRTDTNATRQGALFNDYGTGSELWLLNTNLSGPTTRNYLRDVDGDDGATTTAAALASNTWATIYSAVDSTVDTSYYGFVGGTIGSNTDASYDPTTWDGSPTGTTSRRPTLFGFWDGNNTHDFNGLVSEVLIYDHILTSGEQAQVESYLASKAVPEPSSAALLGLGGLALILRRRK